MPYFKFGPNDIFNNNIETHPKCEFLINNGSIYYNGYIPEPSSYASESGEANPYIKHVPSGHLSLYEINIDRQASLNNTANPTMAYQFAIKDGSLNSFRTINREDFSTASYGQVFTGSYPLSATLAVETHPSLSAGQKAIDNRPHIVSLQNTLNHYTVLSPYFSVSNSPDNVNKLTAPLTLVSIPSIFYGSSIEKGTVNLKYYLNGVLTGELNDSKRNGELVQSDKTVAGVVLYNEGFIVLFGGDSHWLDKWGQNDSNADTSTLSLNGTSYIPTVTMFAHAKKGELNHSNNPTYLTFGQDNANMLYGTGSLYAENSELEIKNTVKSPYDGHDAIFQKQTWISQIGIYDEDKNLIAIAKLANPVRKTEDREFTFKLKLDF